MEQDEQELLSINKNHYIMFSRSHAWLALHIPYGMKSDIAWPIRTHRAHLGSWLQIFSNN